jgi:hypothetical protein
MKHGQDARATCKQWVLQRLYSVKKQQRGSPGKS